MALAWRCPMTPGLRDLSSLPKQIQESTPHYEYCEKDMTAIVSFHQGETIAALHDLGGC